jgi:hypothetical protein
MKIMVLCNVISGSLVDKYQNFGGTAASIMRVEIHSSTLKIEAVGYSTTWYLSMKICDTAFLGTVC